MILIYHEWPIFPLVTVVLLSLETDTGISDKTCQTIIITLRPDWLSISRRRSDRKASREVLR